MKGNKYLISIVECSKIYSIPRDKIYAETRKKDTDFPFVIIGHQRKVHVPLLEKMLEEKAANRESLF